VARPALTRRVEGHLTPVFVALGARRSGRIRPDAHDHLAAVLAAQQRQERLRARAMPSTTVSRTRMRPSRT
jgi:hypothetical protein